MNMNVVMETIFCFVAMVALTKPMGVFMAQVCQGGQIVRSPSSSSILVRQNQRRENYEHV
jgi:hypothetical protein